MPEVFAVVVAIEAYQERHMSGVKYAHNDAHAFVDVLHQHMGIPRSNITIWLDQDATVSRLQYTLKAKVQNLNPDDRFYFFYAGHGFWAPIGGNRLTAWDTHVANIQGTTVSVEEVLLSPLRQSRCKQSAIFIDACATEIFESPDTRDLLSTMKADEFAEFVKNTRYSATFFSCSPEEKSYSSDKLKHGVWTYHLARALRGEEPGAIYQDKFITGSSLQNYLLASVRKFTREQFSRRSAVQTPYAKIDQNGTFILSELPDPPDLDVDPILAPEFENAWFTGEDRKAFKAFDEFSYKKKHTVPREISSSASAWAQRLLATDIEEECQHVAVQARKVLNIRSKDILKKVEAGSGTVDTDIFRFELDAMQNPDNPSETLLRREVHLRSTSLPAEFDEIFVGKIDTLIVPVPGTKGRYVELLDQIEEREDQIDLSSEGNQTTGVIEIRIKAGPHMVLDTRAETLRITVPQATGCLAVLEVLKQESLVNLAGSSPKLIG